MEAKPTTPKDIQKILLIPPESKALKTIGFTLAKGPGGFEKKLICSAAAHKETPSAFESRLASKPHRWKQINDITKDALDSYLMHQEELYDDGAKIFGLPNRDEIVRSFDPDWVDPGGTMTEPTAQMFGAFDLQVDEFEENAIGLDSGNRSKAAEYNNLDSLPIYQAAEFSGYAVGLDKTLKQFATLDGAPSWIASTAVQPNLTDELVQITLKQGGDRIKTHLGQVYKKELRKKMATYWTNNASPYTVGKYFYRNIGPGELWYWNRITRSELSLILNTAYNKQAKASGILYDRWSAAGNACEVCSYLSGKSWKRGDGPEPVTNTHPHCQCILIGFYMTPNVIQSVWDQPSPYKS